MTCPFAISRRRPGRSDWPDQELDRQLQLACPITVLPISEPDRNPRPVLARRERMTMLAELVDVVIGVDTHKHTHTAAVVDAATGAVLDDDTVATDPDGYAALVALADRHSGCGRGRSRAPAATAPVWPATSPSAARSSSSWTARTGRPDATAPSPTPSTPCAPAAKRSPASIWRSPAAAGERAALAVLVGRPAFRGRRARRSRNASCIADRRRPPSTIRHRFRRPDHHGRSSPPRPACASIDRWDLETASYAGALRSLARRIQAMQTEAANHEQGDPRDRQVDGDPTCSTQRGVGPIVAATRVVRLVPPRPLPQRSRVRQASPASPRSRPRPG